MKYSLIVPCLNAADTIEACLNAIRSLRHADALLEIIVVDNGSQDSTMLLAEKLADIVLSDPALKISGLRNLGAKHATGEILIFVDADCVLAPDWIEIAAAHFTDPKVGMVGAKTHLLPDNATWLANAWKVHLDRTQSDPSPQWLVTRALAVRGNAFEAVAGFDEQLETCEDVALGHAVGKNWKIVSDARLAPLHLKDADSVSALFRKELWRGKDSIQTSLDRLFVKRIWDLKEALSLALPFYFSLMFVIAAAALLTLSFGCLLIVLVGMFAPIGLLAAETANKTGRWDSYSALCAVYAVYIAARVCALFYSRSKSGQAAHG